MGWVIVDEGTEDRESHLKTVVIRLEG